MYIVQASAPFKPDYAAVRADIADLLEAEDYDDGEASHLLHFSNCLAKACVTCSLTSEHCM